MRAQYEATGELDRQGSLLIDGKDDLTDRADAMDRAARAAKTENTYLRDTENVLRRSAKFYGAKGSSYAPGGSTYGSQVPRYAGGKRT
jgi:Flp pilus assembly protein TadG